MKLFGRLLSVAAVLIAVPLALGQQQYAQTVQRIAAGVVVLNSTAQTNNPVQGVYGNIGCWAPYAFFNLNATTSVKPAGWSFYNPLAPGAESQEMQYNWESVWGLASQNVPAAGAPVAQNNFDYWAVNLNTISDAQVSQFNVLLVAPPNGAPVALTAVERERLGKFVDQGGILWIDSGAMSNQDITNNFPLAFANAPLGGAAFMNPFDPLLSTPYTVTANDLDVLESSGYGLQAPMFGANLGLYAVTNEFGDFRTVTGLGNPTIMVANAGDGAVVLTSTGVAMALNNPVGAGNTINYYPTAFPPVLGAQGLTAAKLAVNIVSLLQNFPQQSGGSRKTNSNAIDTTAPAIANFFDNGLGYKPAGYQTGTPQVVSPPVLYKGIVAVTSGNQLIIYDQLLNEDLDGDGDPDDGIGAAGGGIDNAYRTSSVGDPFDIVWESNPSVGMQAPLSTPVCVSVPNPVARIEGAGFTDQVLVRDSTGKLFIFPLFVKNAQGLLVGGLHQLNNLVPAISSPTAGDGYNIQSQPAPSAPTVTDSIAVMADANNTGANADGTIWLVDLCTDQLMKDNASDWFIGGDPAASLNVGFTATPTVGEIAVTDNNGGYDRVIYAPGLLASGQPGSTGIPAMVSAWLGSKGETPVAWALNGTTLQVATRDSSGVTATGYSTTPIADGNALGTPPIYFPSNTETSPTMFRLGPKLTLLGTNGVPIPLGAYVNGAPGPDAAGNGIIDFPLNAAGVAAVQNNAVSIRVDYTLDWGNNPDTYTGTILRGQPVQFPVPQTAITGGTFNKQVLGSVALTPAGTACVVVADPNPNDAGSNGSLYWLREVSRGVFSVTGRYTLFPDHHIPLNQAAPATSNAVFEDADPLVLLLEGQVPPIASPMEGWRFTGPPAVINGQVFALATATKAGTGYTIPVTVVMAFQSEPTLPHFAVPGAPQTSFQIVQPDFDRSDNTNGAGPGVTPDTESSLASGTGQGVSYDTSSGVISFTNLAGINSNNIMNCLSLSQPVVLRINGVPDTVVQPETLGGAWSPLLWYATFNGTFVGGQTSGSSYTPNGPLVTGNTVFFAGDSVLPSVFAGALNTNGQPFQSPVLNAIDAQISGNDQYVVQPSNRPWQNQAAQILYSQSTGVITGVDYHVRMPSGTGVTNISQYATRVLQTVLGTYLPDANFHAYGVAGGGASVVAWGDEGLFGLNRANFVVCDQGRVLTVDSNGNATYQSNVTTNSGPGGGGYVANTKPLVRPTHAYPISANELLVSDPGGDQIAKVNISGAEERSITSFFADPQYKPIGFTADEPLTLKQPNDVATWSDYVYLSSGQLVSNQGNVEYWTHYLIPDTGNNRLVELIDRYTVNSNGQIGPLATVNMADPNVPPQNGAPVFDNVPQAGVLFWQSPATANGKGYSYNSVSRVYLWGNGNNGSYVYVTGVGGVQPTRIDVGLDNPAGAGLRQSATGNGGVVVFEPPAQPSVTQTPMQVFNQFDLPSLQGTPFYDANSGQFDVNTPASTPGQGQRQFSGVASVTARSILNGETGAGMLAIMVAESSGVYEFQLDPTQQITNSDLGTPDWFIDGAAYTGIRNTPGASPVVLPGAFPFTFTPTFGINASQFNPAYAMRLESGDVMIVNSYNGLNRFTQPYQGEVLLLNGQADAGAGANSPNGEFGLGKTNLGFNIVSIHFSLPPVSNGVRGLVAPIFADRR